jgi:hypothetical protein
MGQTILFSEMTPASPQEGAFNAWYDGEHIPLRMTAPGFEAAQRYRDGTTLNYLAIYEMNSPTALATPEYKKIKNEPSVLSREMLASVSGFTRYVGTEVAVSPATGWQDIFEAPTVYAVFFRVPTDRCADFDKWYDQDHVPILLTDKRWLGVRRFEVVDGVPHKYNRLALHYLASRDVLDSEARQRARQTPWRARLAAEPWFKGHYVIFDRIGYRHKANNGNS